MIPQHLACRASIEAAIRIEKGTCILQSTAFQVRKDVLQLLYKLITVIMIPSNNSSRRNDVSLRVSYWQDVAGLGFLSALIGHGFAPFFAALWLPSRLISDKFKSPVIVMILASKSLCKLPSLLHLRK